MADDDRDKPLRQLIKKELEARAHANTWCRMIFAIFVSAMWLSWVSCK
jgi:hypothetical protein